MASLISKRKGNKTYYYVVTSARVNGQPRITSQTYLGTAERLAALVRHKSAPVPLAASAIDLGLPGALWRAAQRSGAFAALQSLWPRRVHTDGSYCSSSDPRILFGLGKSGEPRIVRVHWPGGKAEEWPNLEVDRYWVLQKGKPPR